mmetsp:Transcript_43203/g.99604  ORF Transcript_43203/g.99604 Transcript_43203/m.99604 type:complete len:202 (-) Transcript_43203:1459-2064(-)
MTMVWHDSLSSTRGLATLHTCKTLDTANHACCCRRSCCSLRSIKLGKVLLPEALIVRREGLNVPVNLSRCLKEEVHASHQVKDWQLRHLSQFGRVVWQLCALQENQSNGVAVRFLAFHERFDSLGDAVHDLDGVYLLSICHSLETREILQASYQKCLGLIDGDSTLPQQLIFPGFQGRAVGCEYEHPLVWQDRRLQGRGLK